MKAVPDFACKNGLEKLSTETFDVRDEGRPGAAQVPPPPRPGEPGQQLADLRFGEGQAKDRLALSARRLLDAGPVAVPRFIDQEVEISIGPSRHDGRSYRRIALGRRRAFP